MTEKDEKMINEIKTALHGFIVRVANGETKTTSNAEVQALAEVVKVYCEIVKLLEKPTCYDDNYIYVRPKYSNRYHLVKK